MYTIDLVVDTPRRIAGLEHACALFNASLPEGAEPLTPELYVRYVAGQAVISYARQKIRADFEEGAITKAQMDAAMVEIENGG